MNIAEAKYRTIMGPDVVAAVSGIFRSFGPHATSTASVVGYKYFGSNDQFFSEIETHSSQTIICTGSDAATLLKNVVAVSTGSTSAYAWLAHNLIQTRNLSDRYATSGVVSSSFVSYLSYFRNSSDLGDVTRDALLGLGDCGVVSVKKIKYGENIRPLYFTITTSAGVDFSNTTSGDNTWGILTRTSDGASAGVIFYDLGVALIHGPSLSAAQAISAVTAVTLQSTYKIWQLNAFCTATPDDFRYSDNPTAFYNLSVTGDPQWNPSLTSFASYGYQWGTTASSWSASRGQFFLNRLGETWGPYITTIGLYSDSGDCLAVAKLAAPIKKPRTYPITFRVALDFD